MLKGTANLQTKAEEPTSIALLPLSIAMIIGLGISIFPQPLINASGQANHAAASILLWAMSAGFVRGVGYIPKHRIWRWLFSGWACALGLVVSIYLLLFQTS